MFQILGLTIQFCRNTRKCCLILKLYHNQKSEVNINLIKQHHVAKHRQCFEPWFFGHHAIRYSKCSDCVDFDYLGTFSLPSEYTYLKSYIRMFKTVYLDIFQIWKLTEFNEGVWPCGGVNSVTILVVKLLWQVLQKGISQLFVEVSIT